MEALDEAEALAERVRASAAMPIALDGNEYTTTLSIGVVIARPGESVEIAVARADRAMYTAKSAGRNRVVASEQ
jgi:diguanylate cyclase (GGDEF)-like protein